jgi:tetratricopeptide (TPR) repeat protein
MLRAGELPQLPKVPQELRELIEDRQYDEAVAAIGKLLETKPANADYLTYLSGRAQHLAGKHRKALETFARIERDFADSPWLRRARFGQAAALLKLGDFEAAEHIYEQEVRFLLSTERKHEIASIYLEFADAYFQPADKDKKPDYAKALNFYKKALEVGPNPERRIEVEFRVARCHQELGQHAEAAAAYEAFLKTHAKSPLDIEARYQLGAVQLAQGQNVAARKTWKDLLDAHADEKSDRLAEASYHIAHTYGLPQSPSKEDLELAVAAAERFIAGYPEQKLAPKAALEIAQGYVVHNRLDEAVAALKKLLAAPRYAKAEVLPDARTLLGFAYQRQKKFSEAIAAWQDYLARHPAHQAWAQVQQAIIDTEFLTALEARREAAAAGAEGVAGVG